MWNSVHSFAVEKVLVFDHIPSGKQISFVLIAFLSVKLILWKV